MIRRLSMILILAVVGCGGDGGGSGGNGGSGGSGGGGTGGTGGGGGASADLAMPADLSSAPGFCGGKACTGGTTCCVVGSTPSCMSSCPDGGLSVECQQPSDCPGGATAACCITVANYVPTAVMCTQGSQCVPSISAQGEGKDRACVTATDCTDNGGGMNLPDCCTSTDSGQHVCFSKAILMAVPQLNSKFTCP